MSEHPEVPKYMKIKRYGREEVYDILADDNTYVTIQEKYDGANGRVFIKDGKLVFGSHNVIFWDVATENKRFGPAFDFIREAFEEHPDMIKSLDECVIYFEIMIKHTLPYDWARTPKAIVYDIFVPGIGYADSTAVDDVITKLGLPLAKELLYCPSDEGRKYVSEVIKEWPMSEYGDFPVEGVVIKNSTRQMYAKLVREEFKELNRKTFMGSEKPETYVTCPGCMKIIPTKDDTHILLNKYVTPARIEKMIYKITDEGEYKLDMPMMKVLPSMVLDDVKEEFEDSLFDSRWVIDFGRFKKKLSHRCAKQLKFIIGMDITSQR